MLNYKANMFRIDSQDRRKMAGKGTSVLNLDERKVIEECCLKNLTNGRIASILDRAHSTIKQEIRKNGGKKKYNAIEAQRQADLRQKSKVRKLHKFFTEEQVKHIFLLASSGKSITYIARELSTSVSTMSSFLKMHNKSVPNRNYTHFIDRIETLETHINLIYEILEEIRNDIKNKRL